MHRAENVDVEERLKALVQAIHTLASRYNKPIICSLHPRTKSKMEFYGTSLDGSLIHWLTPFGFFDFVALEKKMRYAFCQIVDSTGRMLHS